MILASEDIGNADPHRAGAGDRRRRRPLSWSAGPEAEYPESGNALPRHGAEVERGAAALGAAKDAIASGANTEVPLHLANASFSGARGLGYGRDYRYPHDFPGHWVGSSTCRMASPGGYYEPSDQGYEVVHRERLRQPGPASNGSESDGDPPAPNPDRSRIQAWPLSSTTTASAPRSASG